MPCSAGSSLRYALKNKSVSEWHWHKSCILLFWTPRLIRFKIPLIIGGSSMREKPTVDRVITIIGWVNRSSRIVALVVRRCFDDFNRGNRWRCLCCILRRGWLMEVHPRRGNVLWWCWFGDDDSNVIAIRGNPNSIRRGFGRLSDYRVRLHRLLRHVVLLLLYEEMLRLFSFSFHCVSQTLFSYIHLLFLALLLKFIEFDARHAHVTMFFFQACSSSIDRSIDRK